MSIISLARNHAHSFKALFDACFSQCHMPYAQTLDKDFLQHRVFNSSLYATDCSKAILLPGGNIGGFALANARLNPQQSHSDYLYLNVFFVSPAYQRRGLGRELILALRNTAQGMQRKAVKTSLQWYGLWPGFFVHHQAMLDFCRATDGSIKPGELFVTLELEASPLALSLGNNRQREAFIVRPYQNADFDELRQFVSHHFSVGWTQEVLNKVDATYEHFNGYGLANPYCPGDVSILEYQKTIGGFCIVQSNTTSEWGFFGPVGLKPELRNKGIGQVMLSNAARYLKEKGKKRMGLWTSEAIFQSFYAKYGLCKRYETIHVEWEV